MGLKTAMHAGMSRAFPFAHLSAALPRARRAQDDDGKDPRDDDRKERKGQRAQDDDRKDDDGKDDPDAKAEDDDKPDDDDDSGKGRRSRKARAQDDDEAEADDDDDDESEMRGSSAAASARRREQARCAAIFATRAAARNPALAAQLAFKTRLPRSEAIAMLEAPPPPAMGERAARNPRIGAGGSPEVTSRQAIAAGWDRAFAKANPH